MLDSRAKRGRLIVNDPSLIDGSGVLVEFLIAFVEHAPFENVILPPRDTVRARISEWSATLPFS